MNDCQYIRVGTQYFKIVSFPLLSGDLTERMIPWNYDTIRHDMGASFISSIPKYNGFCVTPSHNNYKRTIGDYLNRYQPIEHMLRKGSILYTEKFLRHLFEEQFELELDYLTIIYKHPLERLPIKLLVSKERETSKTTYLNWLKKIFGGNATFNSNEDFRSSFNSHWTNMLLILIDEVLLERVEDSEKIKNLSTARTYKAESKGIDKIECEFFAKFVLASNNEENGIVIQPGETRYWVRKIKTLPEKDPLFLDKLFHEIPFFLEFLSSREIKSPKVSRMWFSFDQIKTPALFRIMNNFRGKLEVETLFAIREIMDAANLDTFYFANKDLLKILQKTNFNIERVKISRLLQETWGFQPSPNSLTYTTYGILPDGQIAEYNFVGRYYSIPRNWIDQKHDELMK